MSWSSLARLWEKETKSDRRLSEEADKLDKALRDLVEKLNHPTPKGAAE